MRLVSLTGEPSPEGTDLTATAEGTDLTATAEGTDLPTTSEGTGLPATAVSDDALSVPPQVPNVSISQPDVRPCQIVAAALRDAATVIETADDVANSDLSVGQAILAARCAADAAIHAVFTARLHPATATTETEDPTDPDPSLLPYPLSLDVPRRSQSAETAPQSNGQPQPTRSVLSRVGAVLPPTLQYHVAALPRDLSTVATNISNDAHAALPTMAGARERLADTRRTIARGMFDGLGGIRASGLRWVGRGGGGGGGGGGSQGRGGAARSQSASAVDYRVSSLGGDGGRDWAGGGVRVVYKYK